MDKATILVTGATGNNGGNAVRTLLENGHQVRAFVHELGAKADSLSALGAEVVQGDLLDVDSISAALQGIRSAYFVYPIKPQLLDATVNFAQAAKEAGVTAIVNTSQMTSRRDSKSHAAQNHWLSEQVFDWCGVPVTHLRPTLFAEWLLYPFSWGGNGRDTLTLPFGTGRFAPIACEDQGRVIAAILANPGPHAGRLYRLFGPVEMDLFEIAAAASEALGRTITYSPVDVDHFVDKLSKMPHFSAPYFVQHVGAIAIDCQNGITSGTNDNVQELTGQRPLSIQEFVGKHLSAFRMPQAS